MYKKLLNLIIKTLSDNGYTIEEIETVKAVNDRKNGRLFTFEDHIAGMVYAFLGNQRQWKTISDNYELIKEVFRNFDPDYLQSIDPTILTKNVRDIKCGNRSIASQMNSLRYNIDIFKRLVSIYGSMDSYVTSDEPLTIARELSEGQYKLKQMGLALTIEYLKNVGIDAFKPDLHIKRLFGKNKLGFSDKEMASEREILDIVNKIAQETNIPIVEIDSIIWQFCASNYAQICGANPQCEKCLVRTMCNYKKTR